MTTGSRRLSTPDEGGREWRDLLLRLLDGIKDDLVALERQHQETDRYARSAFSRVEAAEDKLSAVRDMVEKLHDQANESTLSIVEIKTVAKTVGKTSGLIWGLASGILGGVIVTVLVRILQL